MLENSMDWDASFAWLRNSGLFVETDVFVFTIQDSVTDRFS